ncbi:MAG TPA: FAD-dependent oxidoreductase [Chloroflexota bacterium]|nr:FAD-dependent oxidoreductase [Chloroflexota bacterium]
MSTTERFDVIVVGAGHAGCEAALAAARMGRKAALFSLDASKIALMPCNPSIGGPGKGHLVREVDALGGEMARNADRTSVQIRRLNTGKGPAVQALRVQSDKHAYSQAMAGTILGQPDLRLVEASVEDLLLESEGRGHRVAGVVTSGGMRYQAPAVVLTTGTFLRGRIIVGDESRPGGREGEFPADALSQSLDRAGFSLGRLKTGTPPRVRRQSIDFSRTSIQEGSPEPLFFSYAARTSLENGYAPAPSADVPILPLDLAQHRQVLPSRGNNGKGQGSGFATRTWREQLNCFLMHTNEATHDIIRRNLHRAPMFNGDITAPGPRYCPSIEAKVVRFAEKSSHQLFLEPEGWHTDEIYVQGANTSLPVEVQLEMLQSIPALTRAEIVRPGYAIEYDYIPGTQVLPTLETKLIAGLFLAGQIVGTTGYEEAASLGLMAGINAAQASSAREPVVLRRDQAYIGVLIDDLVTKELREPYRMHTSQAEYRLLLREDSAEARLTSIGHEVGLIDDQRFREVQSRQELIERTLLKLDRMVLTPNADLNQRLLALGCRPLADPLTGREALSRADISLRTLNQLEILDTLPSDIGREVETAAKYAGYVERQQAEVRRLARMESRTIPAGLRYASVSGLRSESVEKLELVRPRTIGQAARIGGVSPSDVAVLLFHLERQARSEAAA